MEAFWGKASPEEGSPDKLPAELGGLLPAPTRACPPCPAPWCCQGRAQPSLPTLLGPPSSQAPSHCQTLMSVSRCSDLLAASGCPQWVSQDDQVETPEPWGSHSGTSAAICWSRQPGAQQIQEDRPILHLWTGSVPRHLSPLEGPCSGW